MKASSSKKDFLFESDDLARGAMGARVAASAALVNRTHRVVRERALSLKGNRSRVRGLLLPMLLSSTLMLMVLAAVWSVLDGYDLATELPATSNHFIVLLLWFGPVSGAVGALIWSRRGRGSAETETPR